MHAMNCIVCNRDVTLDGSYDEKTGECPCPDGVLFHATGNYGTSQFDNWASKGVVDKLELYLCDECLRDEVSKRVWHIQIETETSAPVVAPFTPKVY